MNLCEIVGTLINKADLLQGRPSQDRSRTRSLHGKVILKNWATGTLSNDAAFGRIGSFEVTAFIFSIGTDTWPKNEKWYQSKNDAKHG